MNTQSISVRVATVLIAASTMMFAACGKHGALDARAAVPATTEPQPSAPDPMLDRLEAVTHHG